MERNPTPREQRVQALLAMTGGVADVEIVSLYSPSQRKVPCVLLAAAYGVDRRVTNLFDSRDWFLSPADDMVAMKGTLKEWARIASAKPEDRPGPEDFASGRMGPQGAD